MKTALRILILLLVLLIAIPATVIALLTTSYANQTWAFISEHLNLPIQAEKVHYDFPYHLTVQGIRTNSEDISSIEQVDVWLNPDVRRDGKWIVDSLLINGVSLKQGLPDFANLESVQFHQVAVKNLDYANKQLVINGLNVQIQSPDWQNNSYVLPYGEIQLSAAQIYWNGEAFDNVLLDMDYRPENSTLYGTSFKWRDSLISGQGEQYPQGWSLVNVTVDKLKMNNAQLQSLLAKPWNAIPFKINHINSLDLLNADIEWGDWHWQNLELSLEDASLPLSLWQTQAQISLQADSVSFQEQTAIEPRLSAVMTPSQIELKELYLDWQQGRVQISGQFQPTQWQIDNASIYGLKWAMKPDESSDWWQAATKALNEVTINQLDIEHSQIIQISRQPYWQVSGLNLEGRQLDLKRLGTHWSVWNGNLDVSVVNASYDQVIASHAALSTQSDNGLWQLTRLFAPLEQGYIEGYGQIDVSTTSQPWTLNINADGIPLRLFHSYLPKVLTVEGLSDLNLDLQGLAGDHNMLAYSLTGDIEANFRDTMLLSQADQSLKSITFSPVRLQARRGEVSIQPITISGSDIKGKISGAFDLANNPLSGLEYQLEEQCGVISGDIFSHEPTKNDCIKPAEIEGQESTKETQQPELTAGEAQPTAPIAEINMELQEEELVEEIVEEDELTINAVADEALTAE
ncbi:MAG: AsmA family protein [Pseudomonadota bacterium]|uniref:AsmA family protein n=2 Tax=Vibrio natriegens TaxID=691 RepID=A0AAN0Y0A6_VIBNA|nr:AsmA family protein [Vibrio natriegens]ALR16791.1 AsmA family protein [Vibrio natriegens NBRC 15636 = ATCC 14048 = DSM 759]ANQ11342.1 AsmA family protein [Vibrio natriegens NBRC 15636 = ATCC 14048 = DSM 759]MDX6025667.1 AsmA family protein [Vibrio natriegens NBRC 15636 = ATCC 14048 = DSM 759]UUI11787.1 AsmA family protein [Vibrio natriegens]WRS48626.1 AsmA family protein [Vibrio natriegens NBRC 15636 = ATCC 14048 = DSM 759]